MDPENIVTTLPPKQAITSLTRVGDHVLKNYVSASGYTLLGICINNIALVQYLLDRGLDPNGKTENGVSLHAPLTRLMYNNKDFKDIVSLVLTYGGNINEGGRNGSTLLNGVVYNMAPSGALTDEMFNTLVFLLEKGANPNGTCMNRPLMYLDNFSDKDRKELLLLLTCYGMRILRCSTQNALPKFVIENIELFSHYNLSIARELCEPMTERVKKVYYSTLRKKFKLKSEKYEDIDMCVGNMVNHPEQITDSFVEIIKNRRKRDFPPTTNETILTTLDDIFEFTKEELIFLDKYVYHQSEIPNMLIRGEDPNRNKLLLSTKRKLVRVLNYTEPTTLLNSIEEWNKKDEISTEITTLEKIQYIDSILKTHHLFTYIDTNRLANLPNTYQYEEIGNMFLLNYNLNTGIVFNSAENEETNLKRMRLEYINFILNQIERNNLTIEQIGVVINQIIHDSLLLEGIRNLLSSRKDVNTILVQLRGDLIRYSTMRERLRENAEEIINLMTERGLATDDLREDFWNKYTHMI